MTRSGALRSAWHFASRARWKIATSIAAVLPQAVGKASTGGQPRSATCSASLRCQGKGGTFHTCSKNAGKSAGLRRALVTAPCPESAAVDRQAEAEPQIAPCAEYERAPNRLLEFKDRVHERPADC